MFYPLLGTLIADTTHTQSWQPSPSPVTASTPQCELSPAVGQQEHLGVGIARLAGLPRHQVHGTQQGHNQLQSARIVPQLRLSTGDKPLLRRWKFACERIKTTQGKVGQEPKKTYFLRILFVLR